MTTTDLDDAYANTAHIPGSASYPARWAAEAEAFRAAHPPEALPYGDSPRQAVDLFRPEGQAEGLVVFIHGGYWLRFGRRDWSHLAAGALSAGWAVALPGYDLCPAVRITEIVGQIARAVERVASEVGGPLRLTGHSAGGHLAARMGEVLAPPVLSRVVRILPISPVADLAPLMRTSMNADLKIDGREALEQSPVHRPAPSAPVHVWVGAGERPAFVEQATALSQAWGAPLTVEPGRHHFDVIEGLERPDSPLTRTLLS